MECAECCGDSPCPRRSHLHLYSTSLTALGSNRFLSRQAEYCATYDSFKHLHLVVGLARDLEEFDRDCRACEHPLPQLMRWHVGQVGERATQRGVRAEQHIPLRALRRTLQLRLESQDGEVLLLIDASLLDEARRCYGAAEQLEAATSLAWRRWLSSVLHQAGGAEQALGGDRPLVEA